MRVTVSHQFLPRRNSVAASRVMDHFGIGFEQGRHVIAEDLEIPLTPGSIVLFTGDSGSGKSSLMRAIVEGLRNAGPANEPGQQVVVLDELPLPRCLLVEAFGLPADEAMQLLCSCGLGEAQLMLRTSAELSDGQRYRFRLALAVARNPAWVVADEFTATLDRTLAKVISFNVRRMCDRSKTGFLLATTHEDLAEDLSPEVHVTCRLGGEIRVEGKASPQPQSDGRKRDRSAKKKRSRSPAICGFPPAPEPTGRTSLGGITEATVWG